MPIDFNKPMGPLKKNQPGAGIASVSPVPILCTVMSSNDPTFQGILQVFPSEQLNPSAWINPSLWLKVNRLASYAGQTAPEGGKDDFGAYAGNPSAYGQWNSPPDKETQVVCFWVGGDLNYGFYIGTAPKPETLGMIPAIGSSTNVILNDGEAESYGGAACLPTASLNTNNPDLTDSVDYLINPRPVHSYVASIMQQQGVIRDKYRGPISSSATREASSRVGWGVSTPGRPIYQGGLTDEDIASNLDLDPADFKIVTRRGGHSLVMDDGDIIGRDQLIRLRTALGHQILMSDDGQMLSILHSNGQSYIELGKEGTVDIFSTNSVNVRTQGDLNLHADETLNLSAKNININSSENTVLNADKAFSQRVGEDYSLYTLQNLKMKADAAFAVQAVGQVGIKSDAEIFNEGAKIHLNDGAASLTPEVVESIDVIMHPDTLFDDTKGWAAALAKLPSITSRAPAHMPWMNANQGADVEVNPDAEAQLPASPSTSLTSINDNIDDLGGDVPVVNPSAASNIPEVSAISNALDKNTTTTLLAGVASKALTDSVVGGAVASLTNAVDGVKSSASSLTLGTFGQTPSQLAAGGILKPGADTLVNTLISSDVGGSAVNALKGAVPSNVLPDSTFTGKGGVSSVSQYVSSDSAQAKGVVQTLQKGQTALQNAGAVTGKEAASGLGTAVSGVLSSASDSGNLGKNVSQVSNIVGKATSGAVDDFTSQGKDVLTSMKSGAKSVLSSQLSGGLGGITKALDTISKADLPGIGSVLDTNIGPSASSFKAITASFGKLEAGVPQDLSAIAGAAAAAIAGASEGMSSADLANPASITDALASKVGAGAIEGIFGDATSAVTGGVQAIASGATNAKVAGAISNAVSDVKSISSSATTLAQQGQLQDAATKVQRGATATISSTVASGVSNLPGGQKLGESVVNNATGAVNAIADGLSSVTSSLADIGAKAFEGTDVGGLVAKGESLLGDVKGLGDITSNLSKSLSAGAEAALKSALSSLTAGGGSTIKLPVVAINTFDRSTITSLINNVLGNDIIPRPNLLGEIPAGALTAFASLTALRKELTADIKKTNAMSDDVATKQRAVFEAQSNFPAGSPEITQAQNAYESAATAPQFIALLAKVEAARETIGDDIPTVPAQSPAVDPFSDIERAITKASAKPSNQAINSELNDVAPTVPDFNYDNINTINIPLGDYTDNTYSTVVADPVIPVIIVPVDEGEKVIENTVESITSGISDGQVGGAAQSGEEPEELRMAEPTSAWAYTGDYSGQLTGGGSGVWKWEGEQWKLHK